MWYQLTERSYTNKMSLILEKITFTIPKKILPCIDDERGFSFKAQYRSALEK